ncbi:hypothetical protein KQX54_002470 [Cotesia glomerata]|uniref:CCHC-type domain-containing protein n=1 Tax=Cotesia glomerata TaxID=32391 RepID=A0AAV7J2R2_COTGL|nr:hypothetical protein KQX54_002470 [Cotesia glomerata]
MSDDKPKSSYSLRSKPEQELLPGLPLVKREKKHNLTFKDSGVGVSALSIPEFTDDESSEEEPPNNPKPQVPVVINIPQVQVVDNPPQNLVVNPPNNNDPEIELNLERMALNANQHISLNDALVCVPRFQGNPEFVNRLKRKGREIVDCYQTQNPEATPEQIAAFKDTIDKSISECFIQNLNDEIDHRMPSCQTTEDALREALKIEHKINARKESRKDSNINKTEEKKKGTPHKPSKSNRNLLSLQNPGHTTRNCPESKCQVCDMNGHTAKACPVVMGNSENRNSGAVRCQLCSQHGHLAKNCPTLTGKPGTVQPFGRRDERSLCAPSPCSSGSYPGRQYQ